MPSKKNTQPEFKELTYLMHGQLALPLPTPPGLGLGITHHSLLSGFLSIEGSQGFHPEDRRETLWTGKNLDLKASGE